MFIAQQHNLHLYWSKSSLQYIQQYRYQGHMRTLDQSKIINEVMWTLLTNQGPLLGLHKRSWTEVED